VASKKAQAGALLAAAAIASACSTNKSTGAPSDGGGTGEDATVTPSGSDGGEDSGPSVADSGSSDAGNEDAAPGDASAPTCITLSTPQACSAPVGTALPICALSQTGCMDPANPTHFAANAIYYEVNSPFWSDGAAKTRAFVLPDGGTIHVKDCEPDAGDASIAECVAPNGVPSGSADTGKWVFPVGTVMIKNFLFSGKLVETRLLMHVDGATAALIANGTDWVGYNYEWNEAQTEATIAPNKRVAVTFDAGTETVTWNYPSFQDCILCHTAATGTLGPETDQMNRTVDGGNQIATFVAKGFFDDTAPKPPYAAPMLEPYANAALGLVGPPPDASVEELSRSYLSANCGFCHRPDVHDLGFDLRYSLTFAQVGICGLPEENSIPNFTGSYEDFAPGDHASSSMWIRMNIPIPLSDPGEEFDVGRMPLIASYVVDTQAVSLIGQWIDSTTSCPSDDGGADGAP
jgi:cytochrome c551/c552